MKKPEELELEFDKFFLNLGLKRVSEILGDSPKIKNADYISLEKRIIIELKILDADFFKEGGIICNSQNKILHSVPVDYENCKLSRYLFLANFFVS
ncbi:hypothetical protein, partial [Leptospira interrogans]